MKKRFKLIASIIAIFAITGSIAGAAQENIKNVTKANYRLKINDASVDLESYLIMSKNNTTYVPLRFISEKLGARVDFDQGQILISLPKRQETSAKSEADTQKIYTLEKKLELLEKENRDLKQSLDTIDSKLVNVGAYKPLPTSFEGSDNFKVTVNSISNMKKPGKTIMAISIANQNQSGEYFYFKPEFTVLTVNGVPKKFENSSGNLLSTLLPVGEGSKNHILEGDLEFEFFDDKSITGSVTFYYAQNNINTMKSATIYFSK